MTQPAEVGLLALGLLLLLVAWTPLVLRRTPLSLPMLCVGLGFVVARVGVVRVGSVEVLDLHVFEREAEFVLIVALMGAGLRIDRPIGWSRWQSAWRLLAIAMPVTILALTVLAHWGAGLAWPAALLAGASLAPTDPVLAAAVGAGPPGRGEEGEARLGLSVEAGLNDGLAFPFVALALALSSESPIGASWLVEHFVWNVALSIALGWGLGRAFGWLVFRAPPRSSLVSASAGLVALGVALLTYACCELTGAYGFVGVFLAAVALRRACPAHDFHRSMDDFASQVERALSMLLMFAFGYAIGWGLLEALTPADAALGLALLLVVRPLSGWLALLGMPQPAISRATSAFFGVRGIGTLYYLVYAYDHGVHDAQGRLAALIAFAVLCSIVVHGAASEPWMRYIDRVRVSQRGVMRDDSTERISDRHTL